MFLNNEKLCPDNEKCGFEFLDQIYVINLEKCVERREHIKEEFQKHSISKYQFFKATDKRSKEVKDLLKDPKKVLQYPPCFRCLKTTSDGCRCQNNFLIPNQIGNWCSFIDVFKDIKEKGHKFCMICEDDIAFYPFAQDTLSQVFPGMLSSIDPSKPILIRLENRGINQAPLKGIQLINTKIKDSDVFDNRELIKYMSNACFVVNLEFANAFLETLETRNPTIDHTSDVFIHCKLSLENPRVQSFNCFPAPAYQLSSSQQPKFYSEIHPRGIDEYDRSRLSRHKQRIEDS